VGGVRERIAQGDTIRSKMSVKINPIRLRGPWRSGFALDLHTTSSVLIGTDSAGHKRFDTVRPPMGELLYRLKYGDDPTAVDEIVETVVDLLRTWKVEVDCIVPVPPSKSPRFQPLLAVAKALSHRAGIPLCGGCVSKVAATGQLKDETDYRRKIEALGAALKVNRSLTQGSRVLLVDDLFQTGATVETITRKLLQDGGAAAVYLLTLTKSRR
jgi:predicted amidophosphoribosyltransferase